MAKLKLKTLRISNNCNKTIEECYKEYMNYCKSIGQREGTLISKESFYKYQLDKVVNPNVIAYRRSHNQEMADKVSRRFAPNS